MFHGRISIDPWRAARLTERSTTIFPVGARLSYRVANLESDTPLRICWAATIERRATECTKDTSGSHCAAQNSGRTCKTLDCNEIRRSVATCLIEVYRISRTNSFQRKMIGIVRFSIFRISSKWSEWKLVNLLRYKI